MIQSMTAFARRADQNPNGTGVWELRSVNHRYLEVSVRLPETLRDLEPTIRERIRKVMQRGKLECFLKFTSTVQSNTAFEVNSDLVKQLANATDQISRAYPAVAPANVMQILSWPGVLQVGEVDIEVVQQALLQLFDLALNDLITNRSKEGEALKQILQDRLMQLSSLIKRVKQRLPQVLENQRKKLMTRLEEIKTQLNPERLEQEMVLMAQRIDVSEEIDRLEMHINEIQRTLVQGGAVGRRLDFLMQELNREANTLGSKSVDTETSALAVEMKVLIEQLREQVQNIE